MNVSVIIPVFNAERTIGRCLISVYEQSDKPAEIIVVDNNSTDGSRKIISDIIHLRREVPAYCISEVRQGPSFARNRGAIQAKSEIIAFIDADCIASPSWICQLSESFDRSEIGAVAGRIIGFEKETVIGKFHALFTMRELPHSQIFHEFDLVSGGFPTANFSITKRLFEEIGGFDIAMPIYSEDYDLCARIYKAGWSIYYSEEVKVFHQHRQDLKTTWKQSYGFGTGHATLLKKHFRRMLIFEALRFRYISQRWPLRAWIDMASADKKLFIGMSLSILWWPFLMLPILYLMFLYRDMDIRIKDDNLEAGFFEKCSMVLLLLFKSTAMTIGRLTGSFRHRVLCL
jgi:GT2 family glycosyltransferase